MTYTETDLLITEIVLAGRVTKGKFIISCPDIDLSRGFQFSIANLDGLETSLRVRRDSKVVLEHDTRQTDRNIADYDGREKIIFWAIVTLLQGLSGTLPGHSGKSVLWVRRLINDEDIMDLLAVCL